MNAQPDNPASGPTSLRSSISDAAQRIDEVVQAAERVAVELQEDARREADEYLEGRREDADRLVAERAGALSELSQSLVRQVEELSAQSRALASRVDEIAEEFRSVLEQGFEAAEGRPAGIRTPGGVPAAQSAPPPPEAPVADPEPAFDSDAEGVSEELDEETEAHESRAPEEALLRATQMAISGRSRAEIADQLRSEFDLDDPGPLLDQVLGSEQDRA